MKNVALAAGALMTIFGTVFTLQGLGYLQGSSMSDEPFWAIAGPLIAGFGLALVIVVLQNRRRG